MRPLSVGVWVVLSVIAANGEAAPKQHAPSVLVLVLDRSGSMQGDKLAEAKAGALAAVDALHPEDQVAMVAFDSESFVYVPLQRASERKRIADEVARLQAGGGTSFRAGLQGAFEILRDGKLAKLSHKHVVMLSDGESDDDGVPEVIAAMRDAKITISTVSLPGGDEILLGKIAKLGGGHLYSAKEPADVPKLFAMDIASALP